MTNVLQTWTNRKHLRIYSIVGENKTEISEYFIGCQCKDRYKRLKENYNKGTLASMKASEVEEKYTMLDCLVEEALILENATESKESSKE